MSFKRVGTLWADFKEIAHSLLDEEQDVCVLCQGKTKTKTKRICFSCEQSYFYPDLSRCQYCGKLIANEQQVCKDCEEGRGPKHLDKVVAWGHYSGAWRDFIQSVKFKSQPYKLKVIAQPLANWAVQYLPPPNLIVPVPMHPRRLAERGFNQASSIASLLHWELGIPLHEVLERVEFTIPQVGLNRSERLHNLEGAFHVRDLEKIKRIQGAKIWLIDDVITTGATLDACAQELKQKGAHEVYGLTLAAGMDTAVVKKSTVQYNQSMV